MNHYTVINVLMSILLVAIQLSHSVTIASEEDGSPCPTNDGDVPVICGTSDERFDNLCKAKNNGGYEETECTIFCPDVIEPVVCCRENGNLGSDGNTTTICSNFNNTCEAKVVGGYDTENCESNSTVLTRSHGGPYGQNYGEPSYSEPSYSGPSYSGPSYSGPSKGYSGPSKGKGYTGPSKGKGYSGPSKGKGYSGPSKGKGYYYGPSKGKGYHGPSKGKGYHGPSKGYHDYGPSKGYHDYGPSKGKGFYSGASYSGPSYSGPSYSGPSYSGPSYSAPSTKGKASSGRPYGSYGPSKGKGYSGPSMPSRTFRTFRIKSAMKMSNDKYWCIEGMHKTKPITIYECNDARQEQEWTNDEYGRIQPAKKPYLCISKKAFNALELEYCGSANDMDSLFIHNSFDHSILMKGGTHVASTWAFTIADISPQNDDKVILAERDASLHVQEWIIEYTDNQSGSSAS